MLDGWLRVLMGRFILLALRTWMGVFVAREVLAKHDENYMPPEVADALAEAGAGTQYGNYKIKK